ncbi:MAG: holo-ACP synthase [Nitriliruptorales bacterium]
MRPGVDVVAIDRVAAVTARRPGFLARVFTDREVGDCLRDGVDADSLVAAARFAARFAAKEATRKALRRPMGWLDVEVRTAADGAPELWVDGAPSAASVSLAHDAGIAIAFVIATGTETS